MCLCIKDEPRMRRNAMTFAKHNNRARGQGGSHGRLQGFHELYLYVRLRRRPHAAWRFCAAWQQQRHP